MSKSLSDADLDAGLDEAKKKPRYFAIIVKGQTIVKMIVQKKRIKDGDVQFAKREFKGNAAILGVCTRSGAELVLQVENEEPTLKTIKVKEFITEQTGATVKPQWQVVTEFPAVPDSETDGYGEQILVKTQKQEPPSQPASKKEVSYEEVQPEPATSKKEVAYEEVQPQAKKPNAEKPPETAPAFDMTKAKKVKKSLKEAGPKIQLAIKARPQYSGQILALVSQIKACANNTQQDQGDLALSQFRELVALLAVVLKDRGDVASDDQTQRLTRLQKSHLDWDSARKQLHAQLQNVVAAVQKECQNSDDYDQAAVQQGCKKLDIILEKLDTRLIDVLDQALNAKEPSIRGRLEKQAVELINEYLSAVNSDPMVQAVDESGLLAVPIQKSMSKLLSEMAGRLSA